jgi:hypothetical protein
MGHNRKLHGSENLSNPLSHSGHVSTTYMYLDMPCGACAGYHGGTNSGAPTQITCLYLGLLFSGEAVFIITCFGVIYSAQAL